MFSTAGDSQMRNIDEIKNLRQSNPELNMWDIKFRSDNGFSFNNINKPPFNDIRVRQAMQMALDRETIVKTYFSGFGDATPHGWIHNAKVGIGTSFDEWPEAVKKTYRYDPEGAKKLLAEADYPDGFKTRLDYLERFDANYAELAAGYWRAIGVEVEIHMVNNTQFTALLHENSSDGMIAWTSAVTFDAINQTKTFTSGSIWNPVAYNDPKYDALWEAANAAATIEEQNGLLKKANMRIVEQHWLVTGPVTPQFNVAQPWVKGYNGEIRIGQGNYSTVLTRVWVDQDLKREMGF